MRPTQTPPRAEPKLADDTEPSIPMNLEPMARELGALLKKRGETVAGERILDRRPHLRRPALDPRCIGVLRRRRRGLHRRGKARAALAARRASGRDAVVIGTLRTARSAGDPRASRNDVGDSPRPGRRVRAATATAMLRGTPASPCADRSSASSPSRPAETVAKTTCGSSREPRSGCCTTPSAERDEQRPRLNKDLAGHPMGFFALHAGAGRDDRRVPGGWSRRGAPRAALAEAVRQPQEAAE